MEEERWWEKERRALWDNTRSAPNLLMQIRLECLETKEDPVGLQAIKAFCVPYFLIIENRLHSASVTSPSSNRQVQTVANREGRGVCSDEEGAVKEQ